MHSFFSRTTISIFSSAFTTVSELPPVIRFLNRSLHMAAFRPERVIDFFITTSGFFSTITTLPGLSSPAVTIPMLSSCLVLTLDVNDPQCSTLSGQAGCGV